MRRIHDCPCLDDHFPWFVLPNPLVLPCVFPGSLGLLSALFSLDFQDFLLLNDACIVPFHCADPARCFAKQQTILSFS